MCSLIFIYEMEWCLENDLSLIITYLPIFFLESSLPRSYQIYGLLIVSKRDTSDNWWSSHLVVESLRGTSVN